MPPRRDRVEPLGMADLVNAVVLATPTGALHYGTETAGA